jgi:putative FmdB family regulatory protein
VPIYDYLCSNCGARTEVIHGISAPGPRFCPACGAEDTLRKAFMAPTVHFKGSGWAKKDRSSASTKARAKSDSGAETGAGKTGTSGGDPSPSTGSTPTTQSDSTPSDSTSSGGSTSGSGSGSSDAAAG